MADLVEWTAALELLLRGPDGTPRDFSLESVPGSTWHSLFLKEGQAPTRAAMAAFLAVPGVRAHLERWPGDVLDLAFGASQETGTIYAQVRDGKIFFVSGSVGEASEVPSSEGFADWFEKLIGHSFPIEAEELTPLGDQLWGSAGVQREELKGLPKKLELKTARPYTLAGYAGYGVNSYAFYFSRVAASTELFLRLPFGGAYLDPEKAALAVVRELTEAAALERLAVERGVRMYLRCNMGSLEMKLGETPLFPEGRTIHSSVGSKAWAKLRAGFDPPPPLTDK